MRNVCRRGIPAVASARRKIVSHSCEIRAPAGAQRVVHPFAELVKRQPTGNKTLPERLDHLVAICIGHPLGAVAHEASR